MSCTVYDVLSKMRKYDGSKTAHNDVISCLNKHGHHAKMSDAWCTETVMAILYDAGGIDLIGGYAQTSKTLKKNAEKLKIWHSGSSGILPGDIVLFGHDGVPNHTELAVGAVDNLSGNYAEISKDTCQRRKREGRSIVGYVRPKYRAMPEMNDLQVVLCACDVMLNVYGSGDKRKRMLSVFGEKNSEAIQKEVTRVFGDSGKMPFDFAVYISQGWAGNDKYRKKRLGSYYTSAQDRLETIFALRTHSIEGAAYDVIGRKYGNGEVRKALLRFNGYNAEQVQDTINDIYKRKSEPPSADHPRIRVWAIWFFEGNEALYGDSTAIIQYGMDNKTIEHVWLIDTGMSAGKTVKKLKAAGVTNIDAVIISHAHGDHYGALSDVFSNFKVKALYLPDTTGLDKYQDEYGNRIRNQEIKAKKHGAAFTYLKAGSSVTIGKVRCDCIYQVPASSLSEHDDHHFVNNQSIVLRFTLDGKVVYHSAGDLQNEGNNLLIKAVKNLRADIFKTQWHGDANACNTAICSAVKPKIAVSNYHHHEQSGRGTTRKRLEAVGAVVARNAENGDIYIDCTNGVMELSCSKGNLHKVINT